MKKKRWEIVRVRRIYNSHDQKIQARGGHLSRSVSRKSVSKLIAVSALLRVWHLSFILRYLYCNFPAIFSHGLIFEILCTFLRGGRQEELR